MSVPAHSSSPMDEGAREPRALARWSGRGLTALALVSMGLALVFTAVDGDWADFVSWAPSAIVFSLVGALLVARVPHNAVSWLTLVFGVIMAVELMTLVISLHADLSGQVTQLAEWAAWLRLVLIDFLVVVLVPLVLLFPDGRLPSRRWGVLLWLTGVVAVTSFVAGGTTTANWHNEGGGSPNYYHLNLPFRPLPLAHAQGWYDATSIALMVLVLAAAGGLTSRYRHSQAVERQQIKWVLAAVMVMTVVIVLDGILLNDPEGAALTLPLVPLAIGVAVLRYRLFDIDRLVSRTVSYALVTGCVLLTYAAIITLATRLVPGSSNLGVAAATLAAAAVVRPALRAVQGRVDRRFNRPRFDAAATVERFGLDLRHEIELERVEHELLAAVRDTLQPDRATLWTVRS